jgi:hypothetical protein
MDYKVSKKYLKRREPWPSGFSVKVYEVPSTERAKVVKWVFNQFENVVSITFVD